MFLRHHPKNVLYPYLNLLFRNFRSLLCLANKAIKPLRGSRVKGSYLFMISCISESSKYKLGRLVGSAVRTLTSFVNVVSYLHKVSFKKPNSNMYVLNIQILFHNFLEKHTVIKYVNRDSREFWSRRLACATRGGGRKRSWPLFSPTFCFSPTSGILPKVKIPPSYLAYLEGI